MCGFCIVLQVFFFFSSRRRHTRYWRDWSSDVCSSDLPPSASAIPQRDLAQRVNQRSPGGFGDREIGFYTSPFGVGEVSRSEERRVGKECRSRWSPYH